MSGDLSAIRMRVNKIKADCVTPSSNFYTSSAFRADEIARIDATIQGIKDRRMSDSSEFALEDKWQRFKNQLVLFIETDKKVREAEGNSEEKIIDLFFDELEHLQSAVDPVRQSLPAVKAVWDTFKATKINPSLKEFVAVMAEPLQTEIDSMITAERASATPTPPAIPRAQTPEELAIQNSQITLEQERANRAAEKRRLLFQNKPNIAKLTQLLALRIAGGEYGENIRSAFLESHPSVISSSSLLKFLLLEASNHPFIPHKLNQWELEISDENWAALYRAKDQIGEVSPEIMEEVFLNEGSLSEPAQRLLDQLNETVKDIQISREDEQIYGQFLRDILDASCAYQEALIRVAALSDPAERLQVLNHVVAKFGSLDPQGFFSAIDRAIKEVNEDEVLMLPDEVVEDWLNSLSVELEKNPHIMTSFREGAYLMPQLELAEKGPIFEITNARLSVLRVPQLLRTNQSRAFELIEEVLECGINAQSLILPVELFQMLLDRQPMLALEIAKYTPLRERFQCSIQLMHVEGRSLYPSLDLGKLVDRTIDEAREFFESLLFKYLSEPTRQNTQKLKTEIRRLLKYLNTEIGASLPEEVKDLHPEGSTEAQIECALLAECLAVPEEAPESEWAGRDKIRILFFPELVRIGRREEVLTWAEEDLHSFTDSENPYPNPPMKGLARSILMASGFRSPLLDSHTLGTLAESENSQNTLLDKEFIDLYFKTMKSIRDVEWKVVELVALSNDSHEIGRRINNQSYTDFSIKAASAALGSIKRIKNIKRISIQDKIKNCLVALNLIGRWTHDIGFVDHQEAQNIKREFELELFKIKKEYLAILTVPVDQIRCCIELFAQSVFLGKETEGIAFARMALLLSPPFWIDPATSVMVGPFIDLLRVASQNLGIIASREGEEVRQIEAEIKRFIFDLIESEENLELRNVIFIQTAKELRLKGIDISSEAATMVLAGIGAISERRDVNPLLGRNVQNSQLVQLIREFGATAPVAVAEAKILLGIVLQELCDMRSAAYPDPIEKLNFFRSLVEGFELLGNSDQIISLTEEALTLITPENFLAQHALLAKLGESIIAYIKDIHNARATSLSLDPDTVEPDAVELRLIDVMLKSLLCMPDVNSRILFLSTIPRGLIEYGHREGSALHKEFSSRALKLALKEIKTNEEVDQLELINVLIGAAMPIDSDLARRFRDELRQIQESRRSDLKRRRGDDEGDGPSNKKANTNES